jgi:hypothetical protein
MVGIMLIIIAILEIYGMEETAFRLAYPQIKVKLLNASLTAPMERYFGLKIES